MNIVVASLFVLRVRRGGDGAAAPKPTSSSWSPVVVMVMQ
jgi:hypothetical protein